VVQIIVRALVTAGLIYYLLAADDDVETRQLEIIQQMIKFHRKRATFHGEKVIELENRYSKRVESGRMN
jgi:hypothetical protein